MFFNPLFLQVTNSEQALSQLKTQKMTGASYLFSDIIKVCFDGNENISESSSQQGVKGSPLSGFISKLFDDKLILEEKKSIGYPPSVKSSEFTNQLPLHLNKKEVHNLISDLLKTSTEFSGKVSLFVDETKFPVTNIQPKELKSSPEDLISMLKNGGTLLIEDPALAKDNGLLITLVESYQTSQPDSEHELKKETSGSTGKDKSYSQDEYGITLSLIQVSEYQNNSFDQNINPGSERKLNIVLNNPPEQYYALNNFSSVDIPIFPRTIINTYEANEANDLIGSGKNTKYSDFALGNFQVAQNPDNSVVDIAMDGFIKPPDQNNAVTGVPLKNQESELIGASIKTASDAGVILPKDLSITEFPETENSIKGENQIRVAEQKSPESDSGKTENIVTKEGPGLVNMKSNIGYENITSANSESKSSPNSVSVKKNINEMADNKSAQPEVILEGSTTERKPETSVQKDNESKIPDNTKTGNPVPDKQRKSDNEFTIKLPVHPEIAKIESSKKKDVNTTLHKDNLFKLSNSSETGKPLTVNQEKPGNKVSNNVSVQPELTPKESTQKIVSISDNSNNLTTLKNNSESGIFAPQEKSAGELTLKVPSKKINISIQPSAYNTDQKKIPETAEFKLENTKLAYESADGIKRDYKEVPAESDKGILLKSEILKNTTTKKGEAEKMPAPLPVQKESFSNKNESDNIKVIAPDKQVNNIKVVADQPIVDNVRTKFSEQAAFQVKQKPDKQKALSNEQNNPDSELSSMKEVLNKGLKVLNTEAPKEKIIAAEGGSKITDKKDRSEDNSQLPDQKQVPSSGSADGRLENKNSDLYGRTDKQFISQPKNIESADFKEPLDVNSKDKTHSLELEQQQKISLKETAVKESADGEKKTVGREETNNIIRTAEQIIKDRPVIEDISRQNSTRIIKAAEIVKEMSKFIQDGNKNSVVLRLDPEHLGSMKIQLDIVNQICNASIEVDNEAAQKLVESQLPQLYSTLSQSGVQLNSINISLNNFEQKNARNLFTKKKSLDIENENIIDEKSNISEKDMGYNTYEFLI